MQHQLHRRKLAGQSSREMVSLLNVVPQSMEITSFSSPFHSVSKFILVALLRAESSRRGLGSSTTYQAPLSSIMHAKMIDCAWPPQGSPMKGEYHQS
jgi:hypothetical protein